MVFSEKTLMLIAGISFISGILLLIVLTFSVPKEKVFVPLSAVSEDTEVFFDAKIIDMQQLQSGSTRIEFSRVIQESGFFDVELDATYIDASVEVVGMMQNGYFTIHSIKKTS